jgi:hypothetical protein
MNPFGPAAAKLSANWDAHHAGVPHRRHWPKVLGFPQRSETSRSSTIVAVAPDPTEPKPCSRLLICLQINQQTIAGKIAARKAALTEGLRWSGWCQIRTSQHNAHLDQFEKPLQQVATTAIAVGACSGRQPRS